MPTRTGQRPAGAGATTARRRRDERSAEYRAEAARLAPFEQVALMGVGRRIELGMTQEQTSERMETNASTISGIESGQPVTSFTTLERLAAASQPSEIRRP
jgi:ribosome-binding protein aMBF1 (putative translation factor)